MSNIDSEPPEATHSDKPNVFLNCVSIVAPVILVFLANLAAPAFLAVGAIYGIFLLTRRPVHSRQLGRSILLGTLIASVLWYTLFYQWAKANSDPHNREASPRDIREIQRMIGKVLTGTGDVGAFILDSVIAHGGQPKSTNNLPAPQSQWRAEVYADNSDNPEASHLKDWETMKVWATGFQQVTAYLAAAFGPPPILIKSNGITAGFYTQQDIGLSLMFCQDTRRTNDVIVSWWGKTK